MGSWSEYYGRRRWVGMLVVSWCILRYLVVVVQEEEVSQEMLTFHEVINHMQEQEEEVIDAHREVIEVLLPDFPRFYVLCVILDQWKVNDDVMYFV
jgi:uncharacterized protein YqfB (UPF0267 family)